MMIAEQEAGSRCPVPRRADSAAHRRGRSGCQVPSSGQWRSPEFWRCLAKTHCIGSARSPISSRLSTRLSLALPEGFFFFCRVGWNHKCLAGVIMIVLTSSQQMNGLGGIEKKEGWGFLCYPSAVRQSWYMPSNGVINYTVIFRMATGCCCCCYLGSPLHCNTSPAACGAGASATRRPVAFRRSSLQWFLST